jgi:hypothetical protein
MYWHSACFVLVIYNDRAVHEQSNSCKPALIAALLTAITGALTSTASYAYHSPAKYDMNHPVAIVGTVTKYEWANPHVYIYAEQITDAREKIEWEVESRMSKPMQILPCIDSMALAVMLRVSQLKLARCRSIICRGLQGLAAATESSRRKSASGKIKIGYF